MAEVCSCKSLCLLGNHRGNVFDGKVQIAVILDERADEAQQGVLETEFHLVAA